MVIEVFARGSNFKNFIETHHAVKEIDNKFNSEKIFLIFDDKESVMLDYAKVELKIY